jgi:hypothetical protein
MEPKILTRHPKGKRGVNISRAKYDLVRAAIVAGLRGRELTYTQLNQAVAAKLRRHFDGSILWYSTCVKLDLEARKELERVPGTRPQRLRLKRTGK